MQIAVVVLFFIAITVSFYFAAGTLSLRYLNIISITYYVYLLTCYLGASLVYLGFARDHYIILTFSENLIEQIYFFCACCGLGLGLTIIVVNYLLGIKNQRKRVLTFFNQTCNTEFDHKIFYSAVCALLIVGTVSTIYVFIYLGSIPLFDLIRYGNDDAALTRIAATRQFGGNAYIRNIGMSAIVPLTSYCAYAGWQITKTKRWRNLFLASAILALFALTWNLEKSPIIYYCIYLFILRMFITPNSITWKSWVKIIGVVVILIIISYVALSGSIDLSLSSGPLSRLIITPIGAIGQHLLCFPDYIGFLNGASLPTFFANLIGQDEGWIRSGRVVMEVFNSRGVNEGTAGVMNAFFSCEAYANWGYIGVFTAVILVGAFIAVVNCFTMRGEKTIFKILVLIVFIDFNVASLSGGFIDYLYNMGLYMELAILWLISSLCIKPNNRKRSALV